jgi:hypothetical protein
MSDCPECGAIEDEIASLRAQVEDLQRERDEVDAESSRNLAAAETEVVAHHSTMQRALAAEARVGVLEGALRGVAEEDNTGRDCWCVHDGWAQHSAPCKAARRALEGDK